jgi:hypothetical protein
MGRILLFAGILLMIGSGFAGMFAGRGIVDNLEPLANLENLTADLCREGETLVEETGASEYTMGRGYASSVVLSCVDSEGTRRDVTEQFVNGMLGEMSGIFPHILSGLGVTFALCSVGFLLMIAGIIVMIATRGSARAVTVQPYGGSSFVVGEPRKPLENIGGGDTLQEKLRQLEKARDSGVISQTEYDRLRQQILDSML